jgi:HEAT repeat protein
MQRMKKQNALWLCVWLCLCASLLHAQTPAVKPQPIYEQCQSLKAGAQPEKDLLAALASLKDKDEKTRAAVIEQLSRSCDSRVVNPAIGLLKASDAASRQAAVEILGKLGDASAVEPLIELVSDSDWHVRLKLVSALVSFKTFQARNTVLNAMANPNGEEVTDENDMRVRCAAILTLCQLDEVRHSRKAILFLMGLLASPHKPISTLAEQTMWELKNTRNFPTEMYAIVKNDSFFKLRMWAAEWLGKLKMESARDVLTNAAANDKDPRVRQTAEAALKQLGAAK